MNKLVLFLLAGYLSLPGTMTDTQRKGPLRIMSYNIRNAKGMDNKTDYDRVANVIRSVHPDIVAVQELDSATRRSGGKFALKEIAGRCGYHYVYGPAIDYDEGKYGVGVLSKEQPLSVTNVALPGREERRNLEIVTFKNFVVFAVHLSLTGADRDSSVGIINSELKKISKPVYLAGDFNAEPSAEVIINLKKTGWQLLSGEAYTFPATRPDKCIDYIFLGNEKKYKVRATEVVADSMASDHRGIWVDVE